MKMADADSTHKADPILVAEIVRSYVAKNSIAVDQIGPLIATVHRTLSGLGNEPALAPEARAGGAGPALGADGLCRVP